MRSRVRTLARCLRAGLWALVALAALAPAGALGAGRIYWTNANDPGPNAIGFANVDGTGGGGGLDLSGVGADSLQGLALDPVTDRIYTADFLGPVLSVGLDGSGARALTFANANVDASVGIALDPVHRRLYWSNFSSNDLSSANLDGSDDGTLPISGALTDSAVGVVVDPAAGRIYWADISGANASGSTGRLASANLEGGDAHEITIVARADDPDLDFEQPAALAVDPVHGRLYWDNGSLIGSAKLDGTDAFALPIDEAAVGGVTVPPGLAVDPFGGRVYWGSVNTNQLFSANLDGSDVRHIPVAGATLDEPSHVLLSLAPQATVSPAVSGGTTVGATLSCSQGTWAPDLPSAFLYDAADRFAYQWSRDGADLPGATQPALRADAAGAYRCRVTAANRAGETASTSDAHMVGQPAGPPPPRPAPRLTGVSLTHTRFRVGKARTAVAAAVARGTALRLTASEAGRLSIAIDRVRGGRRVKRGAKTVCKLVAKPPRHGACTALAHAGALTRTVKSGKTQIAFSGRIGARALAAGRYRLTVTLRDAGGHASNSVRLAFAILRG